tara:strand:+ start:3850 stop:4746 length:897 start_codon:yes stop_codon:yes gene_type:complete
LSIKNLKPKCLWRSKCLLGEGVLWVSKFNSVFFVDIKKKKIFILNLKKNNKKIIKLDKQIGFISHIKGNFFVLGLKSELRIVNLKNMKKIFSLKIEPEIKNNRINDGKVDPLGRLWFGTMDNLEVKKSGCLYCLDNNLKLHKVDRGYYIPNGPAFLNENNFYSTDSKKKIIYKIKINNKLKILKKKIFLKFNKKQGSPDGMTVDKNNNLWICHYHGACISVYDTKGRIIHNINFPAKNITNCNFGGKHNRELFVTTASKNMILNDLKKYPLSGNLFKVKTNVKGKKNFSFNSNILLTI